jgi:LytS/YehU family sensor histidine kinase
VKVGVGVGVGGPSVTTSMALMAGLFRAPVPLAKAMVNRPSLTVVV